MCGFGCSTPAGCYVIDVAAEQVDVAVFRSLVGEDRGAADLVVE